MTVPPCRQISLVEIATISLRKYFLYILRLAHELAIMKSLYTVRDDDEINRSLSGRVAFSTCTAVLILYELCTMVHVRNIRYIFCKCFI